MPDVRVTCLLCEHPVEVPAREVVPAAGSGPHAPPITEADVLLFRRALADDAILAAWLATE